MNFASMTLMQCMKFFKGGKEIMFSIGMALWIIYTFVVSMAAAILIIDKKEVLENEKRQTVKKYRKTSGSKFSYIDMEVIR